MAYLKDYIHYVSVRFIPGVPDLFNIPKSINVIDYINRIKS